jgi:hypothetical protein
MAAESTDVGATLTTVRALMSMAAITPPESVPGTGSWPSVLAYADLLIDSALPLGDYS